MKYENPKIPEGINTTREHPLKEFAILTVGIFGALIIAVFALGWAAQWAAPHVPFSYEKELSQRFFKDQSLDKPNQQIQDWLQQLATRLVAVEGLPPDMDITVHYQDDDIVNAFATLGGHVVVHRGLLKELDSENAVAMVLAHEIAHIKHRDPIIAAGRGVSIILALTALSGTVGDELAGKVLGNAAILTSLSFSRDQESRADEEGLAALFRAYGHVSGATDLFARLKKSESSLHQPEFMQTHPGTEGRIDAIKQMARANGWPMNEPEKPLPNFLR
ncbi:MAG: hypothetical protein DSZ32_03955 [Gammaproteobacteria bacterium]|nr:MAG: hypothetical protein DSZ32_03955 [Gammaproteobacteria bacterium]